MLRTINTCFSGTHSFMKPFNVAMKFLNSYKSELGECNRSLYKTVIGFTLVQTCLSPLNDTYIISKMSDC